MMRIFNGCAHVNQFIMLDKGKWLVAHNASDIELYLTAKGRNMSISNSIFCEVVLVLKILFIDVCVMLVDLILSGKNVWILLSYLLHITIFLGNCRLYVLSQDLTPMLTSL